MMNDTVREELETKVGRVSGPLEARNVEVPPKPNPGEAPLIVQRTAESVRQQTKELTIKETSPTLIEFQSKNPTMPDWRLQLQNSIRQRSGNTWTESAMTTTEPAPVQVATTNGANALKPQYVERAHRSTEGNERLANALRRIETSRKTYLADEPPSAAGSPVARPTTPNRNYPFNVVSRSGDITGKKPSANRTILAPPKPRLVSSFKIEKKRYDTNKLPPIPQPAKLSSSFDSVDESSDKKSGNAEEFDTIPNSLIDVDVRDKRKTDEFDPEPELVEEIDDLAPFSMRFAASLFDFIIAGFGTLVVLSPFMASGGTWLSFSGLLAFSAAFSIFMFLYLTASIGWWGKTFGMRLFSLELIDADDNVYPTIHQAAVNSAVYLLSMAFVGLGFITILFNEEKRAAHDLVSGTILIRDI